MTDNFVIQPFDTVTVSFGDDALLTTGVVIVPGPAGPQGATGPAGASGPPGATGASGDAYTGPGWFFGNGAPGNIAGSKNTDLYFDLDTGYIYTKTNGSWVQNGSISGPQGVQGVQGIAGPTGPAGVGIQGPTGAQGIQGQPGVSLDINGTVATYALLPPNPSAGDAYVVAADGKLYFYDGTSWPANGDGVPFVGPQGPIGAQGVAGPQGVAGTAATINVGTVNTLNAGSNATVTNSGTSSAAVFNFGIPVGATGAAGAQGVKGDTGSVGATGTSATVAAGTVSTLAAGSTATVVNSGTSSAAVFDFGIPIGNTGAVGATGPAGATGASGQAATITVGNVTTGAAGSAATVSNTGTSSAAVFDFSIPVGATGAVGAQGPTGAQGIQGAPGVSLDINGTVATYSNLPASPSAGDAYVVAADGLLYFYDGTSWPGNGQGVPFVGPQGPTGSAGIQGPSGSAATVAVGTVTTGAAGSTASVSNSGTSSAAIFDFSIPVGATGAAGATGQAATISVGTVTTGAAGSTASVANSGTSSSAVFDFSIPVGDTGAVGATGPAGASGSAATISVGTVTTGAAGSTASVSNSGTSSAAVFDFSIPAGAAGAAGATGDTGPAGPSTVSDTVFTLQDNADATKQARFELSGITTATTRTFTLPNVTSTVEVTANKGQANGYASLGSDGRVPLGQWSYPVVDGGSPSSSTSDVLDGGTP